MKKYLLLLLFSAISTFFMSAQIQNPDIKLEYKSGKIFVNGENLNTDNYPLFTTETAYLKYNKYRKIYKSGVVLTSIGGTVLAASLIYSICDIIIVGGNWDHPLNTYVGPVIGYIGALASVPFIAVGVPLWCAGHYKMKNMCVKTELAITQNGVGLALKF
mgnify:CR=1 FL=1